MLIVSLSEIDFQNKFESSILNKIFVSGYLIHNNLGRCLFWQFVVNDDDNNELRGRQLVRELQSYGALLRILCERKATDAAPQCAAAAEARRREFLAQARRALFDLEVSDVVNTY